MKTSKQEKHKDMAILLSIIHHGQLSTVRCSQSYNKNIFTRQSPSILNTNEKKEKKTNGRGRKKIWKIKHFHLSLRFYF